MANNNVTYIGGRIKSAAKNDPYVAESLDIFDESLQKNQQTINSEGIAEDAHLEGEVAHLEEEVANRYTKEEVNNIISRTPETDVVVIDVPAEDQDDIAGYLDANTPSGSTRANKLYRVPGPTNQTYSEWAWDGTAYIMLANKDYGIDNLPTPGSGNMVKSGGVFNNIGALDISELNATENPHSIAKYIDLSAAIAAIPSNYQKGGMSIKFVQTNDKYVQYRLITDEWSIDTKDWAIADEGVYVENHEFVYVKTDSENKILWAIQTDGGIYYGAGVPQQVINYVQEKISELSLDEYEDIVAFLNNLEKGDKTLQTLLNEKVDKEEDKSLIDLEYASTKSSIDNPEFLDVTTDSEDKVLEGIQQDGTKVIGGDTYIGGNLSVNGNFKVNSTVEHSGVTYEVASSPEYIYCLLDSQSKVILGIKTNGKLYADIASLDETQAQIISQVTQMIDEELSIINSIFSLQPNQEWIQVTTDSEGKILEGITTEGKKKVMVDTLFQNKTIGEIASEEFENKSTLDKFSESNDKLLWNDSPIASETSISTLVVDLPVSDGIDIESGYAYIDSTDRTIKVKA